MAAAVAILLSETFQLCHQLVLINIVLVDSAGSSCGELGIRHHFLFCVVER